MGCRWQLKCQHQRVVHGEVVEVGVFGGQAYPGGGIGMCESLGVVR
jgi:hypothetical protein